MLEQLVVAAEGLTPQLRDDHVEVSDVVGVEDNALRVALGIADPQGMSEDLAYRAS